LKNTEACPILASRKGEEPFNSSLFSVPWSYPRQWWITARFCRFRWLYTGLSTLFGTYSELFNKLSLIIHEKMHIFVPEN